MSTDQYLQLFLSEAQEILSALNQHLIQLEKHPDNKKSLDDIFRHCHTLKGNAAAMGFERIVHLAHAMENLLGDLRSEKIDFNPSLIRILFEGFDVLEALIEGVQQGDEATVSEEEIIHKIEKFAEEVSEKNGHTPSSSVEDKPLTQKSSMRSLSNVNSVRINLALLESLMNTVGELQISKIQLNELSQTRDDDMLSAVVSQIDGIANKLQKQAMQMRLLPLKYILNYFPRMVRDDAQQEGKEVELIIKGSDIGMDRSILDEINDPLIHILRNAVSHGMESPKEREKQGKPRQGSIRIAAKREQNMVIITIVDDGRGMDVAKIKNALLQQNLVKEETLNQLSPQEILMLITLPGFSLSKEVTKRAGRGMGMNVVKSKIDAIGGSFSIQSEPGKGSTFTLLLPVSLAIISVVLVRVDEAIFAIPLHNVIETIKIEPKQIRYIAHQEVVSYREDVLPLIHLKKKVGFENKQKLGEHATQLCTIVCEINHKKIGFLVDEFVGQQEIVVKNLAGFMGKVNIYSGATILSSGSVALILDMASLVR